MTTPLDPAVRQGLEAILFVAAEPVAVEDLSRALELETAQVETALIGLAADLVEHPRGFVLRNVAGGWRYYSHPDAAPYLESFVLEGRTGRLTQAALETLAVVAYKQPISRQGVSDIRGVSADGAIRSLVQRGYVVEVGRDDGPGQAVLFGTTPRLLEQLGLDDLESLPDLVDFLPDEAPDEPALGDLARARRRIAEGGVLPATGGSRWDPDAEDDDEPGTILIDADDDSDDLEQPSGVRDNSHTDEMSQLTHDLDRVTRAAMEQLEAAMAAVAPPSDDMDDDAPADSGDQGHEDV